MKIFYAPGGLSVAELRSELEKVWSEVQSDAAEAGRLEAAGLPGTPLVEVLTVEPDASGMDGGTVALVVAVVGPTVRHVAESIWDEVLLPRLRRRAGPDAIGEETGRDDDES